MTWIIALSIVYLIIGGIAFTLVKCMDGYNPKKWILTFVLTVFLWPLILLAWGTAAIVNKE